MQFMKNLKKLAENWRNLIKKHVIISISKVVNSILLNLYAVAHESGQTRDCNINFCNKFDKIDIMLYNIGRY